MRTTEQLKEIILQTEFGESLVEPKITILDFTNNLIDQPNEKGATIIVEDTSDREIEADGISLREELSNISHIEPNDWVEEFLVTYTNNHIVILYTAFR